MTTWTYCVEDPKFWTVTSQVWAPFDPDTLSGSLQVIPVIRIVLLGMITVIVTLWLVVPLVPVTVIE